jgi:hypothetical protein
VDKNLTEAPGKPLCCSASNSWPRKKITQCRFSASRISLITASSRSSPILTPSISAPQAPAIGWTSMRLLRMHYSRKSGRNLGRTIAPVNRGCDRTPQPSRNPEPRLAAIVHDRVCENGHARGGLRWTRRELGGCARRDDANFIG